MSFGRKKAKPSPRNGSLEPDLARKIFRDMDEEVDENEWHIVQGADLTVGKDKEFRRVFVGEGDVESVELRYPSPWPKER
jgi:tRNA G46 methylase TrmB